MTFTITPGLWLVPVIVAVASLAWALWPRAGEWESHGDYSFPEGTFLVPIRMLLAIIGTLAALLIWRW